MRASLVVAAMIVGMSCSKSPVDESVSRLSEITERMCACKDRACLTRTARDREAYRSWAIATLSSEQRREAATHTGELRDRYDGCLRRVDAETTDPKELPPPPGEKPPEWEWNDSRR